MTVLPIIVLNRSQVDLETQEFSDYWAALGLLLLSQNRLEESGRALIEAIVTEQGVHRAPYTESLAEAVTAARHEAPAGS